MTVSWRGPEGPGMYRENFQGLVDKLSKKYGVEKDKIFFCYADTPPNAGMHFICVCNRHGRRVHMCYGLDKRRT